VEGWELARNMFRLVERRPHSSSEDCQIDTQHNPSTSLFEITYTLLTLFRLVERRPHSSSEDCQIDTQHNPSTSLFEITYTLLTPLGFFWDSVFFGIPRSARSPGPTG